MQNNSETNISKPNFFLFLFVLCFPSRGDDFRKDYSRLAMLCATFPSVPVVALTATASKSISKFKNTT